VIPRLGSDQDSPFPPTAAAISDPDGLLAWGGGLEPQRLLRAYRHGIFPCYTDDPAILWWCPSLRCVMPTDGVRVNRRLARTLRQRPFRLRCDTAFDAVVSACGAQREETWITPGMKMAYSALHRLGHAHSFEAWDGERLAGGLYGVAVGGVFCGESMVSIERDASKVVLVTLCRALARWGVGWLDCQISNPHLERMGAVTVPREAYLGRLEKVRDQGMSPGVWTERFEQALEMTNTSP
jgi:leucyl/phenylalanyl-tRNA--protein transferase